MKLPRLLCPQCGREIAAGPVAGRLGKVRLWRHDNPSTPRTLDGLLSCVGSLLVVEAPHPGAQLELDLGDLVDVDQAGLAPALF